MKKIFILCMLAITVSACTKKQEDSPEKYTSSFTPDQFLYSASNGTKVQVSEFRDETGKDCMIVHANYMYDSSKADISCVSSNNRKIGEGATHIFKQFSYKAKNNNVQVTIIRSKYHHFCTVVHANYEYDSSTANVDCKP